MPLALILAGALVLISVFASRHALARYQRTLAKAHRRPAPGGLTGAEIARRYLDEHDASDVEVVPHTSFVTDYFDPRRRRLFLSRKVANQPTLAAWAVALHEAAHATQVQESASEFKWRQSCIRMSRYMPTLTALILGLLTVLKVVQPRIALILFGAIWILIFLLNAGTLAVEWNANLRLRRFLDAHLDELSADRELLNQALSATALRELGDPIRSPRYFFLSALPGSAAHRPRKKIDESEKDA